MKIRSKLADVDFEFGRFEYKQDHLVVHSAEGQALQSKVLVSPEDIVAACAKALANPRVIGYLLVFPFFLIRYRRRKRAKARKAAN